MKKQKNVNMAEITIIFLVLTSIIFMIYLGSIKTNNLKFEEIEDNPEESMMDCIEGYEKDCITDNGCDGKIYCKDGKWTSCYKNKVICVPGSKTTCPLTSCLSGIKICNECGTDWGKCTTQ